MSHLSILIPIYALSFSNYKTNEKPTKNQQNSNSTIPTYATTYTYGKYFPQHTTTTHRTCNFQNTETMISARRLPAASILQVSAIAVRRAIDIDHRNTAMQFFLMKRTASFYFIDYYYRPLTGAHWDKRYVFFSEYMCFFLAIASNQRALTRAIRRYIFRRCRPVAIMFWHDFGRGEWGRHCHGCRWRRGGRVVM